jgi:hypothetical protein
MLDVTITEGNICMMVESIPLIKNRLILMFRT